MSFWLPKKYPVDSWLLADSLAAHVVGFGHEHQRGDANRYVKFYCTAVDGYKDAKAHVDEIKNEQALTPGMSAEQKMEKM
jgi:hypothetical protein